MEWLVAGLFFTGFLFALPWLLRRSVLGVRKNAGLMESIVAMGMIFISPRKLIPREDVTDVAPADDYTSNTVIKAPTAPEVSDADSVNTQRP